MQGMDSHPYQGDSIALFGDASSSAHFYLVYPLIGFAVLIVIRELPSLTDI